MKLLSRVNIIILFTLICFGCSEDDNNPNEEPISTITDVDGNIYNTITIGNQTWMLENLKTLTFNDGTPITEHLNGMDWGDLTNQTPQYQWSDTADLNNVVDEQLPFDFYGAMYNHWAIESGKLAPEGWRIPSQVDFEELENYLSENGFENQEASALKSSTGWLPSSGNGINAIGFNGLPNGYINALGGSTLGQGICTWATTNVNTDLPIGSRTRVLVQLFDTEDIFYGDNSIRIGSGIRCIKE
ncbi:MAG: fibrobacter succinogenes major paralogous domain-containing protein [Polaribacter sp.]|nr:fibrobacter succinogenes major paralogous domain-containing protein [Polaribacter sp.]